MLVNHQSPTDVVMLFSAFVGRHQIMPNVMWIMDNFIKYSTVGVVSLIRKDFFIFQVRTLTNCLVSIWKLKFVFILKGKARRNESLESLSVHIPKYYLPLKRKWLIIFPEGGFLSKRKKNSQKYGKLHNLPHLELVTIPRVGALKVIMNELKSENAPESSTSMYHI